MRDKSDEWVAEPFPSVTAIRLAHTELLKRHAVPDGSASVSPADVDEFILRAKAAGAWLDNEDDRWVIQGLLDYWVTALLRHGRTIDDATLDEFDPDLAPQIPDAECPFVGLDAFQESDAPKFFGRRRLVADIVTLVGRAQMVAIFGQSGSGKSSLLRSGVIPALKGGAISGSDGWRYLRPIVPGSDPLGALARSVPSQATDPGNVTTLVTKFLENPGALCAELSSDERPVVLVVDQFEELFTLTDDRRHRHAFVSQLLRLTDTSTPGHIVLIAMRSDYETFVAQLPELQRRLEASTLRITPMDATELRETIEGPAEAIGLRFETDVVDGLLNDTLGEPAALPLLQFTLWTLWNHRVRNRVTWDAYKRLGGGRLALARSADAFYDGLIPENQVTARRILLRMVRPGDGLEVTSSRVRRSALFENSDDPDRVRRVLDLLIEQRLVRLSLGDSSDDDQLEVAHEALVRNWPRLVEWLDHERQAIATRRRLEAKAHDWQRLGGDAGGLLDETQLYEAERWIQTPEAQRLGYDPAVAALVLASSEALQVARAEADASRLREMEHAKQLALVERSRADDNARALARSRRQTRGLLVLTTVVAFASILSVFLAKSARQALLTAESEGARAEMAVTRAKEAFADAERESLRAAEQQARARQQERELQAISERVQKLRAAEAAARRSADGARLEAEAIRTDLAFFQGHLRKARAAYQESLSIGQRAAVGDVPGIPQLRRNADDLVTLGDVAFANGDLASARTAFQQSLAIERRLNDDTTNKEFSSGLARTLDKVGDVALAMGELASARATYEESLAIRQQRAAADPTGEQALRDVGTSFSKVGDVASESGDLASARTAYQASLALSRRQAAANPANSQSLENLQFSLGKVGDISLVMGDLPSARAAYLERIAINERLSARAPAGDQSQLDLAVSLVQLGDVSRASGNWSAAQDQYQGALAIGERLAAADPSNIVWQRALATVYARIGDVLDLLKNRAEALRFYQQAMVIMTRLAALDSSNALWKRDIESIQTKISELKGGK